MRIIKYFNKLHQSKKGTLKKYICKKKKRKKRKKNLFSVAKINMYMHAHYP